MHLVQGVLGRCQSCMIAQACSVFGTETMGCVRVIITGVSSFSNPQVVARESCKDTSSLVSDCVSVSWFKNYYIYIYIYMIKQVLISGKSATNYL